MFLELVSTIGEELYYLGDVQDESNPVITLRLVDESFRKLDSEEKKRIAFAALSEAVKQLNASKGSMEYFILDNKKEGQCPSIDQ